MSLTSVEEILKQASDDERNHVASESAVVEQFRQLLTSPPPVLQVADMDSEWNTLQPMIEHYIATRPRSLQTMIGCSELGSECLHCLALKIAGYAPPSVTPDWLPFIGTSVHAQFEQMFKNVEHGRFKTEMRVVAGKVGGKELTGHVDLFDMVTLTTVDWKIVGSSTMSMVKTQGLSQQYAVQASLYGLGIMHTMGITPKKSCVIFMPRNGYTLNDSIPVEYDFDKTIGLWAIRRANLISGHVERLEQRGGKHMVLAWCSQLPKAEHCFTCGGASLTGSEKTVENEDLTLLWDGLPQYSLEQYYKPQGE